MDFIYITFLIGNGFDINLGLNTRYADFYKYFLENASVSNMIKQWIEKEIDLWSDLELQLGKKVSEITDKTLDKFYLDKIELDRLLLEYLEKEQDRFVIDDNRKRLEEEFSRSIKDITDGFTLDDRDSVNNTKTHFRKKVKISSVGEEQFRITVKVCSSPTFYRWVFGSSGKIVIEGPVEVRNAYKKMLQKSLDSMN